MEMAFQISFKLTADTIILDITSFSRGALTVGTMSHRNKNHYNVYATGVSKLCGVLHCDDAIFGLTDSGNTVIKSGWKAQGWLVQCFFGALDYSTPMGIQF